MKDHRCWITRALSEWSARKTTSKTYLTIPTGSITSLNKEMRVRKMDTKVYRNQEGLHRLCRIFWSRDPCSNPRKFKGSATWILMVIIIKKWINLITIHTKSREHHQMVLWVKFTRINKILCKECKWIRLEIMKISATRANSSNTTTNITKAWWTSTKSMKMNKNI